MDIGTGIAVGTLAISAGGVAITALRNRNGNGVKPDKVVFKDVCRERHKYVENCIDNMDKKLDKILEHLNLL